MFLSAILLKRTGTTCKKHSWLASKMADDLSFQFTYSSMIEMRPSPPNVVNRIQDGELGAIPVICRLYITGLYRLLVVLLRRESSVLRMYM